MSFSVNFGHREAFNIVSTPGEEPDHARQNTGFIVDQNCKCVRFLQIREIGAQVIGRVAG